MPLLRIFAQSEYYALVEYICIKWKFEKFSQTSHYVVEYCTIRIHIMRGPDVYMFLNLRKERSIKAPMRYAKFNADDKCGM